MSKAANIKLVSECQKIAKRELIEFRKKINQEINPIKKEIEKLERIYIKKLEKFIVENISYDGNFKDLYNEEVESILHSERYNPISESDDHKTILEQIIKTKESWIENDLVEILIEEENE